MGLIYLRRWDNKSGGLSRGSQACQARDLGLDGHAPFAGAPLPIDARHSDIPRRGARGLARLPRRRRAVPIRRRARRSNTTNGV